MTAAPLVGVTSYAEEMRWSSWRMPSALAPMDYLTAIEAAGGCPVLVPPLDVVAAGAAGLCRRLDAFVVSGGADVDPAAYGSPAHPATGPLQPYRDRSEAALLTAALDAGLPLLAVCRGMQLLNVVCGGTLRQHLPEELGSDLHRPEADQLGRHRIRVAAGSRLAGALGDGGRQVEAACHHHQAIDRLGKWAGGHGLGRGRRDRGRRGLRTAVRPRRAVAP